ncbi:MAG: hypothetical protein ABSG65_33405 [Bryobacteraceae bacterium]|jgi:hypothetical protein
MAWPSPVRGSVLFSVGRDLPNLTYMLSFESLAARDKLGGSYADAEIVSNISNAILRPLDFSPIR